MRNSHSWRQIIILYAYKHTLIIFFFLSCFSFFHLFEVYLHKLKRKIFANTWHLNLLVNVLSTIKNYNPTSHVISGYASKSISFSLRQKHLIMFNIYTGNWRKCWPNTHELSNKRQIQYPRWVRVNRWSGEQTRDLMQLPQMRIAKRLAVRRRGRRWHAEVQPWDMFCCISVPSAVCTTSVHPLLALILNGRQVNA